jgi:hypothetical protein
MSHNNNATSPTKTQRVTHIFSEVQQDCLSLKMEATQPFETTHKSRTNSNADDRTVHYTAVITAVCSSQLPNSVIPRPANQLSAVQPL